MMRVKAEARKAEMQRCSLTTARPEGHTRRLPPSGERHEWPPTNDLYLRIPAEDPRRFGPTPAIWSPIKSGMKVRSHR